VTRYQPARGGTFFEVDFDRTPFTLAWEITRACGLACVHCRAEAHPWRDPDELNTQEGLRLIDRVVELGKPILVVTGGDPLMRDDVYDLLDYAVQSGLRVALSPSATGRATRERLARAKAAGTHMLHLSLDGSTAEIHDGFRRVRGSFDRTMRIMRDAHDLGFITQIGTTVSRYNVDDLAAIAARVAETGVDVWTVFFLVPTGRAETEQMLDAVEHERVFRWLYDLSEHAPFHVRTIAAQPYRRVVIEQKRKLAGTSSGAAPTWEYTGTGFSIQGRLDASAPRQRGVNDGRGFCFVSHTGDVYPSGFLQVSAGNVRQQSLVDMYRNSGVFRDLRDATLLKGKCGMCEYREVCGGSRARAFALTGDYLAPDPSCVYVPAGVPVCA
jgi:AdoMet-dependent heme synthase